MIPKRYRTDTGSATASPEDGTSRLCSEGMLSLLLRLKEQDLKIEFLFDTLGALVNPKNPQLGSRPKPRPPIFKYSLIARQFTLSGGSCPLLPENTSKQTVRISYG